MPYPISLNIIVYVQNIITCSPHMNQGSGHRKSLHQNAHANSPRNPIPSTAFQFSSVQFSHQWSPTSPQPAQPSSAQFDPLYKPTNASKSSAALENRGKHIQLSLRSRSRESINRPLQYDQPNPTQPNRREVSGSSPAASDRRSGQSSKLRSFPLQRTERSFFCSFE